MTADLELATAKNVERSDANDKSGEFTHVKYAGVPIFFLDFSGFPDCN